MRVRHGHARVAASSRSQIVRACLLPASSLVYVTCVRPAAVYKAQSTPRLHHMRGGAREGRSWPGEASARKASKALQKGIRLR